MAQRTLWLDYAHSVEVASRSTILERLAGSDLSDRLEREASRDLDNACIGYDPAEPRRVDPSGVASCDAGAGIAKGWSVHDVDAVCAQLKSRLAERQLETLK